MDYIEINKFTQEKKVTASRHKMYQKEMNKVDALRLIVYACKRMYGISNTSKIIHSLGVKSIELE